MSGRLGKRRAAVLRVLAEHGRHTARDVLRLLGNERHGLAEESVREVLADLNTRALVEPDEPHTDWAGVQRGTWRITDAGRSASQGGETR